jgi:hypothetical protein
MDKEPIYGVDPFQEAHLYHTTQEAAEIIDNIGIVRFLELLQLENPQQDVLVGRLINFIEHNWKELTKEVYI